MFGNQKALCPTQFGLVWDHCRLTVAECCLQLDPVLPHCAVSPLPAPSSAQEAIALPDSKMKRISLLFWHGWWCLAVMEVEEASAWDSYFSQRRGHLYFCVGLRKVLQHVCYLTFTTAMLASIVPSLQDDFKVSVCRVLAAYWMCLRFTAKLMPVEGVGVYETEYS